MSMLLFHVGKNRYVIETSYVERVIPKVSLTPSAHSIYYLLGLLNYGGDMIPVIDFCQLIEQRSANSSLYTRIILLRSPETKPEGGVMIGLLAEKVIGMIDSGLGLYGEAGHYHHHLSFLDHTYNDADGVIHHVNLQGLLQEIDSELY